MIQVIFLYEVTTLVSTLFFMGQFGASGINLSCGTDLKIPPTTETCQFGVSEINLSCDTNLKVFLTTETRSAPSHSSD